MRRFLVLVLAVGGLWVAAALPTAASASASCAASWTVTPSWTHDDAFLFQVGSDGAGDAMAAGWRYILNTAYKPLILKWNGQKWVPMSVPARDKNSILAGIAVDSATSAVAIGTWAPRSSDNSRAFAEVLSSAGWTISYPVTLRNGSAYLTTELGHLASTSPSNVWAVGSYISASHTSVPLIEHFDEGSWTVSNDSLVGSYSGLADVATNEPDNAWAVGGEVQNGVPSSLVEHWNGSGWQVVSSPVVGTSSGLSGVAISSTNDVWAVGRSYDGSITVPIAMHWDGAQWSTVPVPNPTPFGGYLNSVTVVGPNDVWAFGAEQVDQFAAAFAPLIEHWDGTAWSVVPDAPESTPGGDSGYLESSTLAGGHLLTVGYVQPTNTAAGSTAAQQMCPIQLTDAVFSPTPAPAALGQQAFWSVPATDAASHAVTDDNGTGLFVSPRLDPGASFDFEFDAAGNYEVIDPATGHVGTVAVQMTAAPANGTTTTSFTVRWASAALPAGYVSDVQIRRPGASAFSNWLQSQTATGTTFTPDAGPGTYSFRARLRKVSGSAHTLWSAAHNVNVS